MTFTELLQIVSKSRPKWKGRIWNDSRWVTPGDVFVAIEGTHNDGHDYIDQAIKNGAAYIVCQHSCDYAGAEMIIARNTSYALGELAQASLGNPSAKMTNLAVTGTNGKTTVAYLTRSIIEAASHKCGMIGTIVYDTTSTATGPKPASLTTPDAREIAMLAKEMVTAGTEYMVIEASSHALDQNRLAGVDFTAAAFTNLTGDHLDYHKTKAEYLKAKLLLFTHLPSHATAILNKQSPEAKTISKKIDTRILWYAIDKPADIIAHIEKIDATGTDFKLEFEGQRQSIHTPLIGRHNISNHLAAAGLALASGFDLQTIATGLSNLECIPGRLERADQKPSDPNVFIDYAHTDDALENVLTALRPICKGKLIVLFGCGGDRDKTKRPRMAKVAQAHADIIFVTSDNPRTEDPEEIIKDILTGFGKTSSDRVAVQPDRKTAINMAIDIAESDDIVLLAGKGHEDYQIIGTTKIDFDDKKIAQQALDKK